MKIKSTPLDGLKVIETDCYNDERGFFLEIYQKKRYEEFGICENFSQENQSRSMKNVLRGLHFQIKNPQAQIVTVMRGKIFDVCVDLRVKSNSFGKWFGLELNDQGLRQIYMAPGFAHGFCVLSDWADLHYKVTQDYDPSNEAGLIWNDPDLNIQWPINNPIIKSRDASYPLLKQISISSLSEY